MTLGIYIQYETVRLQYWNVELVEWNTGMKEGNVLFNDVLNTFLKRLYSIRHNMVKDHSFRLAVRSIFICNTPHTQDSTYPEVCYTCLEALAGTEVVQMGFHVGSIR